MNDMMALRVCPKCGNTTDADNETCPYCGYRFGKPSMAAPVPRAIAPDRDIHRGSGEHEHDHVIHLAHSPLTAAICSLLFIGWGQWYNGSMWAGIRYIGLYLLGTFLFVVLGRVAGVSIFAYALYFIFFLVMAGTWVFGIFDAYSTAKKITRGEVAFDGKSRLFWLPVGIYIILIGIAMLAIISTVVSGKAFIP